MTTLRAESTDGIPIICETCGTAIEKETKRKAEQVAFDHNDERHNGASVARAVTSEVDVDTSELETEQKERFLRQITEMVR